MNLKYRYLAVFLILVACVGAIDLFNTGHYRLYGIIMFAIGYASCKMWRK